MTYTHLNTIPEKLVIDAGSGIITEIKTTKKTTGKGRSTGAKRRGKINFVALHFGSGQTGTKQNHGTSGKMASSTFQTADPTGRVCDASRAIHSHIKYAKTCVDGSDLTETSVSPHSLDSESTPGPFSTTPG